MRASTPSYTNKSVVVLLRTKQTNKKNLFNKLIQTRILVKGALVQVSSLSAPAMRVVISNAPQFIQDEEIMKELACFGKFTHPMRMISVGWTNSTVRSVSYTVIKIKCKCGDGNWTMFANTKRFESGDTGHKRFEGLAVGTVWGQSAGKHQGTGAWSEISTKQ